MDYRLETPQTLDEVLDITFEQNWEADGDKYPAIERFVVQHANSEQEARLAVDHGRINGRGLPAITHEEFDRYLHDIRSYHKNRSGHGVILA